MLPPSDKINLNTHALAAGMLGIENNSEFWNWYKLKKKDDLLNCRAYSILIAESWYNISLIT